ncbi:MAG: tRNA (adenosine(37)-N6)-threonylcarbamoyltransferase complex dimerization subunit type 1 TsaB [Clostridium sp.]|jgi:tRNA threonylcarbamoyladenosine biosynthesis protein TsaB|nr:tRNA (adenosine(37)-N6)-threonylcarbamoyltransferase complex dimerization subunit type 1 TsaB [Clostridium sp.]
MIILAIECSAKAASAAVLRVGKCLAECYAASGRTHSETLLPLVRSAVDAAGLRFDDIGLYAVTAGPGSFTGVRIGIAAVKGMALPHNTPCAGVSSLEANAYNLLGHDCLVLPAMDARCGQIYTALFRLSGDRVERLTPDSAIAIDDLGALLGEYKDEEIICVGDGAELAAGYAENLIPAQEHLRLPRAFGAGLCAYRGGGYVDAKSLLPVYLRVPQAERMLAAKQPAAQA